ncbi:MAG: hypothetical protein ACPL1A_03105 [Candidatus Kapaibacteriota bacterium]
MMYFKNLLFLIIIIISFSLFSCEKNQKNEPQEVLNIKVPSLDYQNKNSKFLPKDTLIKIKNSEINNLVKNDSLILSKTKNQILKELLRKKILNTHVEKISSSICDLNYDGKNDIIIFYKIYTIKDTSLVMNFFIDKNNVLVNVHEYPLPDASISIKDILFYKDSTFEVRYYSSPNNTIEKIIFRYENEFNFKRIN